MELSGAQLIELSTGLVGSTDGNCMVKPLKDTSQIPEHLNNNRVTNISNSVMELERVTTVMPPKTSNN